MKIKEIGFVCYNVKSVDEARKFYEGVLGLVAPLDTKEGAVWIEYDLGAGAALALGTWEGWLPGKEGATAAFEVEDFDAAIKELKAHNTPFGLEPMETPVCHMALVSDPDGNNVMIHKRK
jgi:predicted enzyme related to lactoylglutathione lyase